MKDNTPLDQTEKTRAYLAFRRNRTHKKKISSSFTEAETDLINTSLSRGVCFNMNHAGATKKLFKYDLIRKQRYTDNNGNDLGYGFEVTRNFYRLMEIETEHY